MTQNTFVISDTHFGHQGIIEFENVYRGHFKNAEEMDECMVERWNAVVKPNDLVYHLGDVAFKNQYDIVKRLNGTKALIFGNHDNGVTIQRFMEIGFTQFFGMKRIGREYFFTHCPMHRFELNMYPDMKNVHGHIHSRLVLDKTLKPDSDYINVGVELTDFKPIALEELPTFQKKILNDNNIVKHAVNKAQADIARCNMKD